LSELYTYVHLRDLLSFPTRRSSDLFTRCDLSPPLIVFPPSFRQLWPQNPHTRRSESHHRRFSVRSSSGLSLSLQFHDAESPIGTLAQKALNPSFCSLSSMILSQIPLFQIERISHA